LRRKETWAAAREMTWSGMGDGFSLFCGFVLEMETELEGLFKRKIEVEVEWKRNEILGE